MGRWLVVWLALVGCGGSSSDEPDPSWKVGDVCNAIGDALCERLLACHTFADPPTEPVCAAAFVQDCCAGAACNGATTAGSEERTEGCAQALRTWDCDALALEILPVECTNPQH